MHEVDITEQLANDDGDKDAMEFEREVNDSDGDEKTDMRKMVMQQNRKKKKSGGFQSMGLSHLVFKGVIRKGYKMPTPIQRKVSVQCCFVHF
jgi:hypothetical protein